MPDLGILGLNIQKNVRHILNQHPQIYHNLVFTTVNFGIGFGFSKSSRSAFSEGPGR